jgi:hypothetical protein
LGRRELGDRSVTVCTNWWTRRRRGAALEARQSREAVVNCSGSLGASVIDYDDDCR